MLDNKFKQIGIVLVIVINYLYFGGVTSDSTGNLGSRVVREKNSPIQ